MASKAKKRPSKRGKTTADGERRKRATKSAPRKGKKSPTKSPPKSEKTKNITDNEVDQVIEDDEDDEALEEGLPAHSSPPMNQKKLTDLVSSRTLLSSGASGPRLVFLSLHLPPDQFFLLVNYPPPVSPGLPPHHLALLLQTPCLPPHHLMLRLRIPSHFSSRILPNRRLWIHQTEGLPPCFNLSQIPPHLSEVINHSQLSQHNGDGDISWLVEEDE